jgi:hypothetical protein
MSAIDFFTLTYISLKRGHEGVAELVHDVGFTVFAIREYTTNLPDYRGTATSSLHSRLMGKILFKTFLKHYNYFSYLL